MTVLRRTQGCARWTCLDRRGEVEPTGVLAKRKCQRGLLDESRCARCFSGAAGAPQIGGILNIQYVDAQQLWSKCL